MSENKLELTPEMFEAAHRVVCSDYAKPWVTVEFVAWIDSLTPSGDDGSHRKELLSMLEEIFIALETCRAQNECDITHRDALAEGMDMIEEDGLLDLEDQFDAALDPALPEPPK